MMKKSVVRSVALMGFLTITLLCHAGILQVPADFQTIQDGIDAAADGDTVLLENGTYFGQGNRDIDFLGKAIKVMSILGPEDCIIDCENAGRGFLFHSNETAKSVLEGVSITRGFVSGEDDGGGINIIQSSPTIINCIISGNMAGDDGGGLHVIDQSRPQIMNCKIQNNHAGDGAGIFWGNADPGFWNCLIVNNFSSGCGGGAMGFGDAEVNFINCTISGNSASKGGSGIYNLSDECHTSIINCILWPDLIQVKSGTVDCLYSDVRSGYPGMGNINRDPRFFAIEQYSLSSDSPCIDAGTNHDAPHFDTEGNYRPQGRGVDMGAYEFPGWPSTTRVNIKMPSHSFAPGDNCSCMVTVWNAEGEILQDYNLFVVLSVHGHYYYAPTFGVFDSYTNNFQVGESTITVVPEFTWPEGAGSADGIIWYAALTNPDITEIVGGMSVFDFGWSE